MRTQFTWKVARNSSVHSATVKLIISTPPTTVKLTQIQDVYEAVASFIFNPWVTSVMLCLALKVKNSNQDWSLENLSLGLEFPYGFPYLLLFFLIEDSLSTLHCGLSFLGWRFREWSGFTKSCGMSGNVCIENVKPTRFIKCDRWFLRAYATDRTSWYVSKSRKIYNL